MDHIRELEGLIKADGITPLQKAALVHGIMALRQHCRDSRDCGELRQLLRDRCGVEAVVDALSNTDINESGDTTSVYKYFDKGGILLYVGITGAGVLRQRQHNQSKEWWKFVSRQLVEHFKSRSTAHKREVALIQQFNPPFNKQYNKQHAAARRFYLDMAEGRVERPPELPERQSACSLKQLHVEM